MEVKSWDMHTWFSHGNFAHETCLHTRAFMHARTRTLLHYLSRSHSLSLSYILSIPTHTYHSLLYSTHTLSICLPDTYPPSLLFFFCETSKDDEDDDDADDELMCSASL